MQTSASRNTDNAAPDPGRLMEIDGPGCRREAEDRDRAAGRACTVERIARQPSAAIHRFARCSDAACG